MAIPVSGVVDDLPDVLDVNRYCEENCPPAKYQLWAIIRHIGYDNMGHFIADIRMPDSWYSFDDKQVSRGQSKGYVRVFIYKMIQG
jgi:ubiquitin C-terminal hydrolase